VFYRTGTALAEGAQTLRDHPEVVEWTWSQVVLSRLVHHGGE
jgi:hypothetical protein